MPSCLPREVSVPELVTQSGFEAAVEAWRTKHRLAEDDPLVALVELLRIDPARGGPAAHERTKELPSEPRCTASPKPSASVPEPGIHRWVAVAAIALAALGGFVLGRGFP